MFRYRRTLVFFLLAYLLLAGSAFAQRRMIGLRHPALSPDGKQIAFSYMGDIWVVPAEGGRALRLTDHVAYDGGPVWSPDGKWIAFTSNRNRNDDVFIIPAAGGDPVQITFHTGSDEVTDFSPDGRWLVFRSNRFSLSGLYRIPVRGGNPEPLLDGYWDWAFLGKLSPDGSQLLLSLGTENSYWWRRGYRGSNTAKLWLKPLGENRAVEVFGDSTNAFWPCWGPGGDRIYFVSDRVYRNKNIWSIRPDGSQLRPVTKFRKGDVLWLSVARRKPLAVFERNFGIWLADLRTGKSHEVRIQAPAEFKSDRTFWVEHPKITEFQLSPDGKKIAAVARGEIFVMDKDGKYARNITHSPWRERDLSWDAESKNLVYVSDENANPDLFLISALGDKPPVRLTKSPEDELQPRFSPDGRWIAYYRGKRQLRVMKPDGSGDRLVLKADFGGRFAGSFFWSPDSRYLAAVIIRNANQDIVAVNVKTGETTALTNTAYDENNPVWSPNGKFLLFLSNRFGHDFPEFTGKWDIYQVLFEPEKPKFKEVQFEKLFREKPKKKKKEKEVKERKKTPPEVRFRLEDLDRQTRRITNTLGDDRELVLSPSDTSTIYFVSNIDGKNHLWKTSLEEEKRGRYEPFVPGVRNPSQLQIDAGGKFLYYLSGGRIGRIDLKSRKSKTVPFSARLKVDRVADYEQMLGELYYTLQYYYYDPRHHNVDWRKLYEQFRPVLQQVRNDHDFYDYANLLIGFLNSSHTGIHPPPGKRVEEPSRHVGARWRIENGKVLLARIIKNGPLYAHRDSIRIGAELLAVDGKRVRAGENLWRLLNGRMDRRLTLKFRNPGRSEPVTVALKPISSRAESQLVLEEWIDSRKEWVRKKTGDQIAYIYMRAMGRSDLERFLKELERDAVPRKGLILDIRYNFGGNVHDRVLQALTKPVYAKWRIRGLSETQQSTFGFADKPVVLLVNEVTLSDGEMTTNGFKALKRGPIVGVRTYGWIIFTTGVRLMNGGYFRLPFWGCYTLDGRDLETMGGIAPDIFVPKDLNDDLHGRDPQLEKAVEVALKEIKK